jgi:hypothetical protein
MVCLRRWHRGDEIQVTKDPGTGDTVSPVSAYLQCRGNYFTRGREPPPDLLGPSLAALGPDSGCDDPDAHGDAQTSRQVQVIVKHQRQQADAASTITTHSMFARA